MASFERRRSLVSFPEALKMRLQLSEAMKTRVSTELALQSIATSIHCLASWLR